MSHGNMYRREKIRQRRMTDSSKGVRRGFNFKYGCEGDI